MLIIKGPKALFLWHEQSEIINMMQSMDKQWYSLILPAVEALGLRLWGLKMSVQHEQTSLQIYIDSPDARGVNVDQCSEASRQIQALLMVERPEAKVLLEVSSPGLNRHFFFCEQYQDYLGQIVDVRSKEMIAGQGHFRGTLLKVTEQSIYLQMEDQADPIVIEFENIKKAKLIAEIVWNKK